MAYMFPPTSSRYLQLCTIVLLDGHFTCTTYVDVFFVLHKIFMAFNRGTMLQINFLGEVYCEVRCGSVKN